MKYNMKHTETERTTLSIEIDKIIGQLLYIKLYFNGKTIMVVINQSSAEHGTGVTVRVL